MRSPEEFSDTHIEQIEGEHVAIHLHSPRRIAKLLRELEGGRTLYRGDAETMPAPLSDLTIDCYKSSDDHYPQLHATLAFRASTKLAQPLDNWQQTLMTEVRDRLDSDVTGPADSMPHDAQALYYGINPSTVARVSFDASTDYCEINIMTDQLRNSDSPGYDEMASTIGSDVTGQDPYLALGKVLHITRAAADAIIDTYSIYEQEAFSVVIAPPSDELVALPETAPAQEAVTRPPEVVTFETLGGLEAQKERLRDIGDCVNDPVGAARYGLRPSSFILHGPAGTGKTSLVEAFAHYIDSPVRNVSSADIMGTLVGESGLHLKTIFEEAFKEQGRLVLFFDEFDSIAGKPGSDSKSNIEVKNLLKQYITETKTHHANIIIAAATNCDLDDIDPAIVRSGRLEGISVPKPHESERQTIWANLIYEQVQRAEDASLGEFGLIDISTIDTQELARITEDMTGADITSILERARHDCYRQYRTTGIDHHITQTQLVQIIRHFYQR